MPHPKMTARYYSTKMTSTPNMRRLRTPRSNYIERYPQILDILFDFLASIFLGVFFNVSFTTPLTVNGLDMDYYPDKWITGLQLILGLLHSQKRLALVRLTPTGYPSTNI